MKRELTEEENRFELWTSGVYEMSKKSSTPTIDLLKAFCDWCNARNGNGYEAMLAWGQYYAENGKFPCET